jgi:hypothetical protein
VSIRQVCQVTPSRRFMGKHAIDFVGKNAIVFVVKNAIYFVGKNPSLGNAYTAKNM